MTDDRGVQLYTKGLTPVLTRTCDKAAIHAAEVCIATNSGGGLEISELSDTFFQALTPTVSSQKASIAYGVAKKINRALLACVRFNLFISVKLLLHSNIKAHNAHYGSNLKICYVQFY